MFFHLTLNTTASFTFFHLHITSSAFVPILTLLDQFPVCHWDLHEKCKTNNSCVHSISVLASLCLSLTGKKNTEREVRSLMYSTFSYGAWEKSNHSGGDSGQIYQRSKWVFGQRLSFFKLAAFNFRGLVILFTNLSHFFSSWQICIALLSLFISS